MSVPMSRTGSRYHQIGTDSYAVVIAGGKEISERHAGVMWLALTPGEVSVLFVDERGGSVSRFTLTKAAFAPAVEIFVDGDRAHSFPFRGSLGCGDHIDMDWTALYDGMR